MCIPQDHTPKLLLLNQFLPTAALLPGSARYQDEAPWCGDRGVRALGGPRRPAAANAGPDCCRPGPRRPRDRVRSPRRPEHHMTPLRDGRPQTWAARALPPPPPPPPRLAEAGLLRGAGRRLGASPGPLPHGRSEREGRAGPGAPRRGVGEGGAAPWVALVTLCEQ